MGWYEAIKDAATVADRLRDAELKQKLADVQIECAKLAEENANLRQQNLSLKEKDRLRVEMVFRDNVYWREQSNAEREGPFCPRCLDGDGRTARMLVHCDKQVVTHWSCGTCNRLINNPLARTEPVEPYKPSSPWS